MAMVAMSTPIPATAAITRVVVISPSSASRASASTGMPSLAKLFQTPDTTAASAKALLLKPHDRYMA